MVEIHRHPENPDVVHEESDAPFGRIAGLGIGLIVIVVVLSAIVWLLFDFFAARAARPTTAEYPLAAGQQHRLPPEPRLQVSPRTDLMNLRLGENGMLSSYGWVDKNAGVVRIPIDDAVRITLAHGLPTRPGGSAPPEDGAMPSGDSNSGRELLKDVKK
jgi:hypothetical protein